MHNTWIKIIRGSEKYMLPVGWHKFHTEEGHCKVTVYINPSSKTSSRYGNQLSEVRGGRGCVGKGLQASVFCIPRETIDDDSEGHHSLVPAPRYDVAATRKAEYPVFTIRQSAFQPSLEKGEVLSAYNTESWLPFIKLTHSGGI